MTPIKKRVGTKTTRKIIAQVTPDAKEGLSFFKKKLYRGIDVPVKTKPRTMVPRKGTINLPASRRATEKRNRKKKKTALSE